MWQVLSAGMCLAATVAGEQTWQFDVVYEPPTMNCVTCSSSPNVETAAPTFLCLQFPNDCPQGQIEVNAGACLGGVCNDDDEPSNGGGVVLPPAQPRTASPTPAPVTRSPTAPTETFAPTGSPTPFPSPPPPESCGIVDNCNCTNPVVQQTSGQITVSCSHNGFSNANSTESQELQNVTTSGCPLGFERNMTIQTEFGEPTGVSVRVCYGNGQVVTAPEDECKDNTGVIVIIVICVLLLLLVIGVGVYYIVHTTKAHVDEPKMVANPAK